MTWWQNFMLTTTFSMNVVMFLGFLFVPYSIGRRKR